MVLLRRLISAVILLGSVALLLYVLPCLVSVLVLMALSTLGLLEFYGILKNSGIPAFRNLGIAAGLAFILATCLATNASGVGWQRSAALDELPELVLTIVVFAFCVRQFPQKNNPQPLATIACTMLGIMYVPFLLSFVVLLAFKWSHVAWTDPMGQTARLLLMYLIVVVKASDTGAYFVGSTFGRHKLFPRISPGKTWEGLAGGLAAGILASLVFYWLMPRATLVDRAVFGNLTLAFRDAWILGALLACIGVVGDLVESLLKRSAGLKDSGHLLPGMGGILDVLDSLLFAAPALYFYLRWFASGSLTHPFLAP